MQRPRPTRIIRLSGLHFSGQLFMSECTATETGLFTIVGNATGCLHVSTGPGEDLLEA